MHRDMQPICQLFWICSGSDFLSSAPGNSITPPGHTLVEQTMLEVAVYSFYRFEGSGIHLISKFLPAKKPNRLKVAVEMSPSNL